MKCRNHALVKMITCVFAPLALTLLSGEPVSGGLPPNTLGLQTLLVAMCIRPFV